MKCVLQITTPDEIGLVEKASEFIFGHNGSIDSDAVRVYGDWAFLLLHFEVEPTDLERMTAALPDHPAFSGFKRVELIQTNEPSDPQPEPTVLLVWCRDIKGLLARQTKLIQEADYTILSHDGARTLSGDEVNYEYRQSVTLRISHWRLQQEKDPGPGKRISRWDKFKSDLQHMLEPLGGRFTVR